MKRKTKRRNELHRKATAEKNRGTAASRDKEKKKDLEKGRNPVGLRKKTETELVALTRMALMIL